jgi:hypothetical protein
MMSRKHGEIVTTAPRVADRADRALTLTTETSGHLSSSARELPELRAQLTHPTILHAQSVF